MGLLTDVTDDRGPGALLTTARAVQCTQVTTGLLSSSLKKLEHVRRVGGAEKTGFLLRCPCADTQLLAHTGTVVPEAPQPEAQDTE